MKIYIIDKKRSKFNLSCSKQNRKLSFTSECDIILLVTFYTGGTLILSYSQKIYRSSPIISNVYFYSDYDLFYRNIWQNY